MPLNLSAVGKKIGPVRRSMGGRMSFYMRWASAPLMSWNTSTRTSSRSSELRRPHRSEFSPRLAPGVDLAGILHGEHELIVHSPIPA
jgi:hypothetical protein